jgi:integral membrane protein
MDSLIKTKLGWLRIIAFLEGISFLLLLGIAMPLKYIWEMPEYVRVVGMAHGLLFVFFLALVAVVGTDKDWSPKTYLLAFLASVLPFGTFWADVKLFR